MNPPRDSIEFLCRLDLACLSRLAIWPTDIPVSLSDTDPIEVRDVLPALLPDQNGGQR
ncbi:hypothetical protein [Nocardia sp. NPDC004722]